MDFIFASYGRVLVYLLEAGLIGFLGSVMLGITVGWPIAIGIQYLIQKRSDNQDKDFPKTKVIVLVVLSILVLIGVSFLSGFGFWLDFWMLWLGMVLFGLLAFGLLRWWTLLMIGVVLVGGVALSYIFINTLQPIELEKTLLEVKIRGRETIDEQERISVILMEPETGEEIDTYYIYGEDWGIRLISFQITDAIWGLGGKSYMRRDALVGYEGAMETDVELQELTAPAWDVIEEHFDQLEVLTDLEVQQSLKSPVVGATYAISLDAEGKLVVETTGAVPTQESTPTTLRPADPVSEESGVETESELTETN